MAIMKLTTLFVTYREGCSEGEDPRPPGQKFSSCRRCFDRAKAKAEADLGCEPHLAQLIYAFRKRNIPKLGEPDGLLKEGEIYEHFHCTFFFGCWENESKDPHSVPHRIEIEAHGGSVVPPLASWSVFKHVVALLEQSRIDYYKTPVLVSVSTLSPEPLRVFRRNSLETNPCF